MYVVTNAGATFMPAKDAAGARKTASKVLSSGLGATEAIARGFGLKSHAERRAEAAATAATAAQLPGGVEAAAEAAAQLPAECIDAAAEAERQLAASIAEAEVHGPRIAEDAKQIVMARFVFFYMLGLKTDTSVAC